MPLDHREELEFQKLHDDCRRLKVMPPPAIFIGLEVEKDGVILLEDRVRGHSWTRNYWNSQLSQMTGACGTDTTFGAGHINAKSTGGTTRGDTNRGAGENGYFFSTNSYMYVAGVGESNGIRVGTDDTAFSTEQYNLQALIANGTESGQLSYQAQGAPTSDYDSTAGSEAWTITHTRVMNNNSGAAITVKEVGLIWGTPSHSYRFGNYSSFLDERSVLAAAVNVPDGAQLTVTYEITMDFSAID